jgi:carbonic anhydrase
MKLSKSVLMILNMICFTAYVNGLTNTAKKSEATVFEFLRSQDKIGANTLKYGEANTTSPTPGTTPTAQGTTTSAQGTTPVAPGSPSYPVNNSTGTDFVANLNDPNTQLSEWFTISSFTFKNLEKFPTITDDGANIQIKLGPSQDRINEKFDSAKAEGASIDSQFWFKIRGGYIYYFSTKEDINVLGSIFVKKVENSNLVNTKNKQGCFNVYDYSNDKWKLCANTYEIKMKWLCSLQEFLKQKLDWNCKPIPQAGDVTLLLPEKNETAVELKKVRQNVIIIPTASPKCNENWNYVNKGKDWDCACSEGGMQSPINLPEKEMAILSEIRPMFQYDVISAKAAESTLDGLLVAGEYMKIRYADSAIRIRHPNLGKIVTPDGAVFRAQEIIFHTPSEHQINGKTFEMEMQIIHYGISKGDIAKQVVLSFLFKAKPGVYNKFIEKLDFFYLPNPTDTFRDITNDLFIPHIFYNADDDEIPAMKPFSFFTYQGSLSSPPCTSRTTHYVAADPIELSSTVIQLFKEALKRPDLLNPVTGDLILGTEEDVQNTRSVQELNDRVVYIYDHVRYGCPEFKKKPREIEEMGHYEKRNVDVTEYIYVNGKDPSGIPGSFVVSEGEAKGADENLNLSEII